MGKQSARLYYQGNDHKDIYFQGNYHTAMYKGGELVWEKLYENTYLETYLADVVIDIDKKTVSKQPDWLKKISYLPTHAINVNGIYGTNMCCSRMADYRYMYSSVNLKQIYQIADSRKYLWKMHSLENNVFATTNMLSSSRFDKVCFIKFDSDGKTILSKNIYDLSEGGSGVSYFMDYTICSHMHKSDKIYFEDVGGEVISLYSMDANGNFIKTEIEYGTNKLFSVLAVFKNRVLTLGGLNGLAIREDDTIISQYDVGYGPILALKITDDYMEMYLDKSISVIFNGESLTYRKIQTPIKVAMYENGKEIGEIEADPLDISLAKIGSSGNAYYSNNGFKFDCIHWVSKKDNYIYYFYIKDFAGSDENFCIRAGALEE